MVTKPSFLQAQAIVIEIGPDGNPIDPNAAAAPAAPAEGAPPPPAEGAPPGEALPMDVQARYAVGGVL